MKDLARAVIPDEVIDRPKGYVPVPPLVHLEGPDVIAHSNELTPSATTSSGSSVCSSCGCRPVRGAG